MQKILGQLEFEPVSSYERFRTEFVKDKVKFTIDEYPFANFLEIEGKEDKILAFAKELGFSVTDNITEPCDTLFVEWRIKNGLKPTSHMIFGKYDK